MKCENIRCPPGDEVYRDAHSPAGIISVFRVNADDYFVCEIALILHSQFIFTALLSAVESLRYAVHFG